MSFPDPSILTMFRCPASQTALKIMPQAQLEDLNRRIEEGTLKDQRGETVSGTLPSALVNESATRAYAIRGGIIQLIADEAIVLD